VRNEIVDLDLARKEAKAKTNMDIAPVDLLKILIRDIETGVVKADSMLVLVNDTHDEFSWCTSYYRCGLTRERENSMLSIAQHRHLHNWGKGDDDE
jgi:hypothetical protein